MPKGPHTPYTETYAPITVNELIPEAHKYGNTRLTSLGVTAGVLVAFLLTQIGG